MHTPHPRWLLVAALLASAWAAAYAPLIPWAASGWTTGDGLLQGALALGAVGWALASTDRQAVLARLQRPPHSHLPALLLLLAAPALGVLISSRFPLHTVRAAAGIAAAYGIAGLYLTPDRWRVARPWAALALLLLPITGHLDVLLGWPLRKLTAAWTASILGIFGGAPVATETVLQVEGGIAHVDLPCAGVRSLWSGAVLLLLLTARLGRPMDLRWLAIAAVSSGVMLLANAVRVTVLVGLDHRLGWHTVAEVVHQPLGVLGFVASGAVAAGLLWLGGAEGGPGGRSGSVAAPWLPWICVPALLIGYLGAPPAVVPSPPPAPSLPAFASPLPPTPSETAFTAAHGASIVKGRLPAGSVALVASRSWLAHHVPEMCLKAAGFGVDGDRPIWVEGAPLRIASAHRDGRGHTALWWLQSATLLTDDPIVRVRDGLRSDRTWVLVSVLLEGAVDPSDPEITHLIRELRASVARTLEAS